MSFGRRAGDAAGLRVDARPGGQSDGAECQRIAIRIIGRRLELPCRASGGGSCRRTADRWRHVLGFLCWSRHRSFHCLWKAAGNECACRDCQQSKVPGPICHATLRYRRIATGAERFQGGVRRRVGTDDRLRAAGSPAICTGRHDRQTGGFASPPCDGFAKLKRNLFRDRLVHKMSRLTDIVSTHRQTRNHMNRAACYVLWRRGVEMRVHNAAQHFPDLQPRIARVTGI
jgi:hypothetical protein